MRKARVAVLLAMVAALVAAAPASADIVRPNPGGEITLRSLGRITLNTQIYRVECRMTLRGRLFEGRGALEAELLRRPQIGQLTSGSVEECTSPATVRLLFETFEEWLLYVSGIAPEGTRFGMNLLNFQFLIRVPMLFECLWKVLLGLFYDGNLVEVRSITQLGTAIRLAGSAGFCPIPPTVFGRWDLEPDQELTLTREI